MPVSTLGMVPGVVLGHLGSLHTFEAVLVGLLAFGPFVVLGIVVAVVRRRDLADEQDEQDETAACAGGEQEETAAEAADESPRS